MSKFQPSLSDQTTLKDYVLSDDDKAMLARLQDFIPDRVFDAHAHLHNVDFMPPGPAAYNKFGTATSKRFIDDQKQIYGDRLVRGLFLPWPSPEFLPDREKRDKMNAWMVEQIDAAPGFAGAMYVVPTDTAEDIEKMLVHPRIRGFKCYHQSAICEGPTFESNIGDFLPEAAWEVANAHNMTITLHMVKSKALADPANMDYIQKMCAKYPNAVLILAHCGRGFASWTTVESARKLKGIPNVWYDMAAVCEPAPMFEIIRQAGSDHVMWGTDYCIDRMHGRAISVGESFKWLYTSELPFFDSNMNILESMFAFYQASLMLDLTRAQIEDIFYNNGIRLMGFEP